MAWSNATGLGACSARHHHLPTDRLPTTASLRCLGLVMSARRLRSAGAPRQTGGCERDFWQSIGAGERNCALSYYYCPAYPRRHPGKMNLLLSVARMCSAAVSQTFFFWPAREKRERAKARVRRHSVIHCTLRNPHLDLVVSSGDSMKYGCIMYIAHVALKGTRSSPGSACMQNP
jgi:hypothetical protein